MAKTTQNNVMFTVLFGCVFPYFFAWFILFVVFLATFLCDTHVFSSSFFAVFSHFRAAFFGARFLFYVAPADILADFLLKFTTDPPNTARQMYAKTSGKIAQTNVQTKS